VTENHGVGGSIPPLGTIFVRTARNDAARVPCSSKAVTAAGPARERRKIDARQSVSEPDAAKEALRWR